MDNARNGSCALDDLPQALPEGREVIGNLTQRQMRAVLSKEVDRAGGVRAFARKHGIASHAAVSLALSGERPVSEALANTVGYIAETTFRPFTRAAKGGAS